MSTIDVGRDFNLLPSGRTKEDGDANGAKFRKLIMSEFTKLKDGEKLIIDFSDVLGVGSSFLHEAFTPLIKDNLISKNDFFYRIKIEGGKDKPEIKEKVYRYIHRTIPSSN